MATEGGGEVLRREERNGIGQDVCHDLRVEGSSWLCFPDIIDVPLVPLVPLLAAWVVEVKPLLRPRR